MPDPECLWSLRQNPRHQRLLIKFDSSHLSAFFGAQVKRGVCAVKMLKPVLAACVIALSASAAGAEEELQACPGGEIGGWTWEADYSFIKLNNPDIQFTWKTVGDPTTSSGLGVKIFVTDKGETVSSVTYLLGPPTFSMERPLTGDETETLVLFGRSEPDELPGQSKIRKKAHNYALMGVDQSGEQPAAVFSAGPNQWDNYHPTDAIQGVWKQKGPTSLGWGFEDFSALSFIVLTQTFKPMDYYGNQEGWDNIALSEPVDLTGLKAVLDVARPAQITEIARNKFCKPAG